MQLVPGDKLDHFEILATLGAGGMGEVYKARDSRLNRTVAIKVSRSEFSERFEREAKAVATLNHPHIAQLYDVGKNYIVMEYVEGAAIKGPLPLDKTLEYCGQIADALDHAHTRGITHRDLKPANILVGKSGVKILDFGLAKISHVSSDADATLTMALTQVGSVMGTIAYMAPEQLEGKPADARADLYAFGLILYEIATGKRSYPHTDLQTLEPAGLHKVYRRCFESDPENRWQSARDLRHALDLVQAPVAVAKAARPMGWIAAAVLATMAAVALGALYFRAPAAAQQTVAKLAVLPPANTSMESDAPPQISPDGSTLVFIARDASGTNRLWLRRIDSLSAQPLAGTENARTVFWSADSRSLIFQTVQSEMRRVEIAGGAPTRLCNTSLSTTGGTSNQSGQILVGSNLTTPLLTISTAGSRCAQANELDLSRGERGHAFPQFLPDGRHFLYFAVSAKREFTGIVAGSLDSKETKFLLATPSAAVYSSGYLLFMREQALVALPFDPDKLELGAKEVGLAENIATSPFGDAMFSVSANGVLVYRSGSAGTTQLTWVDRSGKSLGTVGPPGEYVNPELSADGKQVAFQRRNAQGDRDVWLMNVERGTPQRFTFGAADESLPVWSPDGSRLAFTSSQDGASSLFVKNSNGGGNEDLLFRSDRAIPTNWSSDGKVLFFRVASEAGINEVWYLPLEGDRKAVPYIQTKQFNRNQPRLSPSGRWLAYYANDAGISEMYLESFPKLGGKWQVSSGGGVSHRWSRDGKEIYFMAPNGDLMAATVKGESSPELGTPTALFRMRTLGGPRTLQGYRSQYDVAPDGRFLVNTPVDESAGASITVVLNWAAGLKATAP